MTRRRGQLAQESADLLTQQDRLRPLWLGVYSALCIATPILPSETVLFGGSTFVLMLIWWLLLCGWCLTGAVRGRVELKLGPATWALFALVAWHSTSALLMAWHGNPRASHNMLWQWVCLGIAFFLGRQLLREDAERRALVGVMIALAVSFSLVGFYQYYKEFPDTRSQYQKDPDKVLKDAGVQAAPGTPQRKMFEDRLNSTEPIATFALTNSLAGFLAPWLIILLGILVTNWSLPEKQSWMRVHGFAALFLILGCLVLTKSRTAWLATLGGFALLGIYGRRAGWRPDWRILAAAGAAVVVLPFLAVVIGGLDWLVVLESSKSFLYRVQYWRATAELIADHPWFGCGPGNFQQYYTAYKLPEASETIAEPHNFLLEIWATAGTPAVIAFLGVLTGIVWQVWQIERSTKNEKSNSKSLNASGAGSPDAERFRSDVRQNVGELRPRLPTTPVSQASVRAVYWGALIGGFCGYFLCAFMEGYPPSPGLAVLGFPIAMGFLVLFHSWVDHGRLPVALLGTAVVVMLVNFLAAGGIGFAGVAQSLWLLAALLLNQAESGHSDLLPKAWKPSLGSWPSMASTGLVFLLLIAFHQTTYSPVTNAQASISDGTTRRILGQYRPALTAFRRATAADPLSPVPWEYVSEMNHEIWLQAGDFAYEEHFRNAVRESLARNARSSHAYLHAGHQWLAAYRRFGKQEYLDEAIRYYGIAVKLYPNYNQGHAQFAWALHLSGDEAAARMEAAEALRLDALNPHQEQKLVRQRIMDVAPMQPNQPPAAGDRNAEQILKDLRKTRRL